MQKVRKLSLLFKIQNKVENFELHYATLACLRLSFGRIDETVSNILLRFVEQKFMLSSSFKCGQISKWL